MLRTQNARTGFLERPAFNRLLRALPADLRPPMTVAYVTGWRLASELLTRQQRHVTLGRQGWLRLERGETKSGEGRMFPLIPELRAAIVAQRKTTAALERRLGRVLPWLFHDAAGAPHFHRGRNGVMVTDYVRRAWARACEAAGVDGALRHDFRRTAARDLLRAGNSTKAVMRLVGWESEAMLRRYTVVEEQDLIEAGRRRARLR
jgi:integrase